jgi:kynurenine formamidase
MCAPFIVDTVRCELSRRRFIAGAAAVAAAMTGTDAEAQQKPLRIAKGFREIVDLTHTLSPSLPVYPTYSPVRIRQRFAIDRDGFNANEVTFDEHTGTHMDAPMHFAAGGASADRVAVDRLIAPLAVVSIAERAGKDADTTVTVDDLRGWEKAHGRIPAGSVVAMYSGWEGRIASPDRFLNRDAAGVLHAPGFSEEAARFLLDQREIAGVGVDTLSLDAGAVKQFVAHLAILGAGRYGLEMLANLPRVPPIGATLVVGAPKHEGATGGPARVLALV